MERWEPPVAPPETSTAASRPTRTFLHGQDAVPETVEIIAPRLAIFFALVLPSSGKVPAIWLSAAGPLLVVFLLGMGALQSRWGTQLSRAAWVMDGITLGIITPILLVNAFAATGTGPLRHAESSVYLQTIVAATIVLAGLTLLGSRLRGHHAFSWGILLLPSALTTVGLMSAYADYKTTSIVLALSLAWLASIVITVVAQVISGGFAMILPLIGYGLYTLACNLVTGCGLDFGGRPTPVSFVHPVFIVVLGVALLAPLLPTGERDLVGDLPVRRRRGKRSKRPRKKQRRPQRGARSGRDQIELDDLEEFRTE